MKPITRSGLAILILISAMLACSLPGATPSLSVDDQAATVIAATLQAQTQTGGVPITATLGVTVTATVTALSKATSASTPSITPTYSTPMLTVLEQTNCRAGPGEEYQVLFTYLAKRKLEIAGRYEPTNFWLVKSPESRSGTCWLWGQYVELSGSYWVVPTLTPPPTATLTPPLAPFPVWNFSCSGGNVTFTMEWQDRATDETGYRVYRDGNLVVELPANSTSYQIVLPLRAGESTSFYLQVYSPNGTANSAAMTLTC